MSLVDNDQTWSHESEGDVGIWYIHDIEELFENDIEEAQQHFRETAGRPDVIAAVVVFDDNANLGRDVQDHMADAWSQLGQAVDLERTAYVAEGVRAMAVKSNVTIPGTDIKAFNEVDAAIEWAQP